MKKDVYELTSPQKNIWELEQINGSGTPINHVFSMLKLRGNLDEEILAKTLNKIVEQNDSFRLKFIKNGKKKQEETTKKCPYCLSTIPIKATKCAHCTSTIEENKK